MRLRRMGFRAALMEVAALHQPMPLYPETTLPGPVVAAARLAVPHE